MDVACAWDSRVTERETEKTSKYQELAADLHHQFQRQGHPCGPGRFGHDHSSQATPKEFDNGGITRLMRDMQQECISSTSGSSTDIIMAT